MGENLNKIENLYDTVVKEYAEAFSLLGPGKRN
jgi:hypothetical protein